MKTTRVNLAPDWQEFLRTHRLDTVAAVYARTDGTAVTNSASTQVRRVDFAGRTLFIKKYWVTRPNQLLSGVTRGTLVGRSKVRREFENLQRLRQWGLDAPTPIAYGEERRAGWLIRSFLITEGIPHPQSLDHFIVAGQSHAKLIDRLATYVRRLHEHHFVHHDLYWRNIILTGNSLDHFHLIDAHKGRCCRNADEQAHDLATLDAPAPCFFRRTERLRFFLRYRQHDRLDTADKQLLRLTLQLAAPMRARQLARVRS